MKTKDNITALIFMLSIPIIGMFYNVLNTADRGFSNLTTDIDRGIPFVKEFIVPYIIWYFYIFLVFIYLCFKDRDTYYKTLITYNIGLIICYIIYYFYQTTVLRPELMGDDVFTKMIGFIYSMDQPFNCFPSIHSFGSFLMMKAINRSTARHTANVIIINGVGILIILSTLFIKQHVILDAVAAMVLGDIIYKVVCYYDRERVLLWLKGLYPNTSLSKSVQ